MVEEEWRKRNFVVLQGLILYTSLHHTPLQESGKHLGLERASGGKSICVSCCCSGRHLGSSQPQVWISNIQQAVTRKAYSRGTLSNPKAMLFCRPCFFPSFACGGPWQRTPQFTISYIFYWKGITYSDSKHVVWWQDGELSQLGSQDSWFSTAFSKICFHLQGNLRTQMVILLNRCLSKWMWRKVPLYNWDLLTVLLPTRCSWS